MVRRTRGSAGTLIFNVGHAGGCHGITANGISLPKLDRNRPQPERSVFMESEQANADVARYIIRRFGKPDDVANVALFLCSDAASWIAGQTDPVNGGYSFAA